MAKEPAKYVTFTFEQGGATECALTSVCFGVRTTDALEAISKAAEAATTLIGSKLACKSVSVSDYSN